MVDKIGREDKDPFQRYADVSVQLHHFVEVCVDKKYDGQYHDVEGRQ